MRLLELFQRLHHGRTRAFLHLEPGTSNPYKTWTLLILLKRWLREVICPSCKKVRSPLFLNNRQVLSLLASGVSTGAERAWRNREGRITRYENKRVGGTVVVHFIKKHMWFMETALAFLEGDNFSETELEGLSTDGARLNVGLSSVWTDSSVFKQTNASAAS